MLVGVVRSSTVGTISVLDLQHGEKTPAGAAIRRPGQPL